MGNWRCGPIVAFCGGDVVRHAPWLGPLIRGSAASGIGGQGECRITRVLDRLFELDWKPEVIAMDNGPEYRSAEFDIWVYLRGIRVHFIQPGNPVQNAHIESFNGCIFIDV